MIVVNYSYVSFLRDVEENCLGPYRELFLFGKYTGWLYPFFFPSECHWVVPCLIRIVLNFKTHVHYIWTMDGYFSVIELIAKINVLTYICNTQTQYIMGPFSNEIDSKWPSNRGKYDALIVSPIFLLSLFINRLNKTGILLCVLKI